MRAQIRRSDQVLMATYAHTAARKTARTEVVAYTYSGTSDATGNTEGSSNGASITNEYVYDNNGNLTKDSNKGITSIAYNCLILPSKVTFSDGSSIVYIYYAADGMKRRTVHTISGTTIQKNCCANVVYENGV